MEISIKSLFKIISFTLILFFSSQSYSATIKTSNKYSTEVQLLALLIDKNGFEHIIDVQQLKISNNKRNEWIIDKKFPNHENRELEGDTWFYGTIQIVRINNREYMAEVSIEYTEFPTYGIWNEHPIEKKTFMNIDSKKSLAITVQRNINIDSYSDISLIPTNSENQVRIIFSINDNDYCDTYN